ncbi:hypothetical protein M0R45_018359 [Rubus argutus]|uniref:Uncharacterized protein n=1 Tax=Rubus argutus TaxID=59490 RepID=A0AAW1X4U0_RUBAR
MPSSCCCPATPRIHDAPPPCIQTRSYSSRQELTGPTPSQRHHRPNHCIRLCPCSLLSPASSSVVSPATSLLPAFAILPRRNNSYAAAAFSLIDLVADVI